MKLTNQLIIITFFIFLSLIQIKFFLNNLSGIDQIRHLSWVFHLSNTDHFLPTNFFENYKSIYNDSYGFIYELFRYSYKDVGHTLNIIPILILYLFSFILGLSPALLNSVSIIFSFSSVLLSYQISCHFFKYQEIEKKIIFPVFFIFIFSSSYIFYFSSLGIHNISLFFFLLTIYFFLKIENFNNFKNNFFLSLLIALACYSHKINALILPIPILLYLIFNYKKNNKRLFGAILMSANLTIFFLPIFFLIYLSKNTIDDNIMYAAVNISFFEIISNLKSWFFIHIKNVGYINFVIFCLSILYYVFKKNHDDKNKILIFIYAHLFISLIINGILIYHIRTSLYSTFILLILNFIFIINLIKNNNKVALVISVILFLNFMQQGYMMINKKKFFQNRADIYNFYFRNIDSIKFSSINEEIEKIDAIIPQNGKVIFYTNLSEDIYFVYSKRKFRDTEFKTLKPIKNLIHYKNINQLSEYLNIINFKKINIDNSYLLAISKIDENIFKQFTNFNKSEIFLNKCSLQSVPSHETNIFVSGEKKLSLYKVNC